MSRFDAVLEKIQAGAATRDSLPYAEVDALRSSGFTRLRVPVEYGGFGATLPEFFAELIALGRADSNLPQLLRGHFGFVESRLAHPDPATRERWLRRIAEGAVFGNAQSELGNQSFWQTATTLIETPGGWRLTGKKFYSTGSILADWIHTTVTVDATRIADVFVPTGAPGVDRLDDWDGFGQRFTGSGTTLFDDVRIDGENVEFIDKEQRNYLAAFFQLVHLATLTGIGQAALAEVTAYVSRRDRNLHNPDVPPRRDPLVQEVVGRVAGAAFAAEATTLAAAAKLEALTQALPAADSLYDETDAAVFAAQGPVINLVLGLVTELFEAGGASAVTTRFGLDRHWRNARTLASHNPLVYRHRIVGDYLLNGTSPTANFRSPATSPSTERHDQEAGVAG